jgi:hypothetical protein
VRVHSVVLLDPTIDEIESCGGIGRFYGFEFRTDPRELATEAAAGNMPLRTMLRREEVGTSP